MRNCSCLWFRLKTCFFLLFTFLVLAGNVLAQERISIKDPDLTFSYIRPHGWVSKDDDFYHYVLKSEAGVSDKHSAQITVTYYDGRCQNIDECFDGEVNGNLANSYPAFTKITSGEEIIDGARARWQKFSYKNPEDAAPTIRYAYYFISRGQFFVVEFVFSTRKEEKEALELVRSFSTEKR